MSAENDRHRITSALARCQAAGATDEAVEHWWRAELRGPDLNRLTDADDCWVRILEDLADEVTVTKFRRQLDTGRTS